MQPAHNVSHITIKAEDTMFNVNIIQTEQDNKRHQWTNGLSCYEVHTVILKPFFTTLAVVLEGKKGEQATFLNDTAKKKRKEKSEHLPRSLVNILNNLLIAYNNACKTYTIIQPHLLLQIILDSPWRPS